MGIFALKDIEPGEELSYNYNFCRFDDDALEKCLCGSLKCSGTVGIVKPLKIEKHVWFDLSTCVCDIIFRVVSFSFQLLWSECDWSNHVEQNSYSIRCNRIFLIRNVAHVLDRLKRCTDDDGRNYIVCKLQSVQLLYTRLNLALLHNINQARRVSKLHEKTSRLQKMMTSIVDNVLHAAG